MNDSKEELEAMFAEEEHKARRYNDIYVAMSIKDYENLWYVEMARDCLNNEFAITEDTRIVFAKDIEIQEKHRNMHFLALERLYYEPAIMKSDLVICLEDSEKTRLTSGVIYEMNLAKNMGKEVYILHYNENDDNLEVIMAEPSMSDVIKAMNEHDWEK